VAAVLTTGAIGAAGCAAQAAPTPPTAALLPAAPTTHTIHTAAATPVAKAAARTAIDRMATTAKQRWSEEQSGIAVHQLLRRVAADPAMKAAINSGQPSAFRSAVAAKYQGVWYHWHASRVRVLQGGRVVADAGVPFVVAPSSLPLRNSHGKTVATLQISDQDVIGFVRYMKRNHHVDVVARGVGAGHTQTSLPAALNVKLPSRGAVKISGQRYQVRAFTKHALNNENVRVWVLLPG
jgi:hypothetical protein